MVTLPFGITAHGRLAATTPGACGQPVTHVVVLRAFGWARCELPTGHEGLHQLTLRWETP